MFPATRDSSARASAVDPSRFNASNRAYFATSSSERVNALVTKTIGEWPSEAFTTEFKAFHFAHAIVVTTAYPFDMMGEIEAELGEDADPDDIVAGAIRVFVDETLAPEARSRVLAEVTSFLNRLARFLGCADPRRASIVVR